MTCSPNSKGVPAETQQDEHNNVIALPDQLERDIKALWRREARIRALAAAARTLEEMRELYEEHERIIPWLLRYPEFNPDPPPAQMSDEEITKMLLEHPDPKWREAGQTGKWRRAPADDVARREDAKTPPEGPEVVNLEQARARKPRKPKPERPSRDLPPWLQACEKDGRDQIIPNLANLMIALRGDPDLVNAFAFDEMLQAPILRDALPAAPNGKTTGGKDPLPRVLRDADVSDLREYMQHYGFPRIGKEVSHEATDKRARELAFHPVRQWLNSLVWDKTPRLDHWLVNYAGAIGKPEYLGAIGSMFLISMVARVFKPGCKVDYMPVFEGPQGIAKSQMCAILAGEWFSDSLPDIRNKDASQHHRGKWLIEISELSAFSRADTEALKAFITRDTERYRPSYGRLEVIEPRQSVFVGTTNRKTYLKDETGGRRFWPALLGLINLRALGSNRSQLFAEAVMRFRRGDLWWPEAAFEARVIKPEQERRRESDPWEAPIAEFLAGKLNAGNPLRETRMIDIARLALGFDSVSRIGTKDQHRIVEVLKALRWGPGGKDEKGRLYIPDDV